MKYKTLFHRLPYWKESLAVRWSWIFLMIVAFFAITGPFVANERPYYIKLEEKSYYPLFQNISESQLSQLHPDHSPVRWRETQFESVWYAPIPYSYYSIDLKAGAHVGPFDTLKTSLRFRHWLGTDPLGRDVMAGMIRGCRVSLIIGLGAMLLSLLIGVPLGSVAAYWGNKRWRLSWLHVLLGSILIITGMYILSIPISISVKLITLLLVALSIVFIGILFRKTRSGRITIPLDQMIMGLISIVDSFPALFIILILLFVIPVKGWFIVLMAIALIRWPVMARYMRAEVYKMKESNYIRAAQILNLRDVYILRHHIIPFAFRPVMISFVFGVSSAILAESSLSFLGIGMPAEELNWGRLLAQARNHFDSWWLVVFPGMAIFFTLIALYTIGNAMQKNDSDRELTESNLS